MQADNTKLRTIEGGKNSQARHSSGDLPSRAQGWLDIQCGMISGVTRGLVLSVGADRRKAVIQGRWPQHLADTHVDRARVVSALESGKVGIEQPPTGEKLPPLVGLYFPISAIPGGTDQYVVFLELVQRPDIERRSAINLVKWGGEWLKFSLVNGSPKESQGLTSVFQLVAVCLDQEKLHGMAMKLVTELASRFRCERVSLGFVKGKRVEVQVLSHSASFKHESNLIATIGAAMDEAVDQDKVIVFPDNTKKSSNITYAHAELARHLDNARICTVPFTDKDETLGALTLERDSTIPFDVATVQQLEQLLAVIAPVLLLKHRDERGLAVRAWWVIHATGSRLLGAGNIKLKAGALVVALTTLIFSIATGTWRVTADAVIEGSVQRTIAAPIDGYIASAVLRAGDVVVPGQEMGTLDDNDLKLERMKWSTLRQQVTREKREAMAQHNRTEVSIVSARIEQADAELALLDEQLSRTKILAPFDGVVIEGDLSQLLGTPVSRGDTLFKVAPLDDYRIVLKVEEKDIAPIRRGQTGKLILTSMPSRKLNLRVENITSVSSPEHGKNFFRVEASLQGSDVSLRPGMEGVGKIDVGRENLFWIWTHKLADWLRLLAWTWWR